jgi:prolipoprotein diacylglyceryltransferase
VIAGLLVGYGVLRSVIEIFRDDDRGVLFGWLSTSQIISVPLIAFGVYLLLTRGRRTAEG